MDLLKGGQLVSYLFHVFQINSGIEDYISVRRPFNDYPSPRINNQTMAEILNAIGIVTALIR